MRSTASAPDDARRGTRPYLVLSALQRRSYEPTMLEGEPVNAEYTFRITMKLP
jgi:hypothetical protein